MNKIEVAITEVPSGTYVVAVSGGVDSVVLLNVLAKQKNLRLIVVHVDHGMRPDAAADARFVARLAQKYNVSFELQELSLGASASEDRARRGRYQFLREVVKKYTADALITAHHADDVIETVVLNVMRGTGWRGLSSLRSTKEIIRPLINVSKKEILNYALEHRLEWCEDATNYQNVYTRNRIRHNVTPAAIRRDKHFKQKIYGLWRSQCQLHAELEEVIDTVYRKVLQDDALQKEALLSLETAPALEILRRFLLAHHVRQTIPQLKRGLDFIASSGNRKRFSLNGRQFLEVRSGAIIVVTV